MNTEKLARQFWDQGYLVLPDFFSEALMDRYNELILDHFGLTPAFFHNDEFLSKAETEVIPWFPQEEGVRDFDIVENDSRLKGLTGAILGAGWGSQYSMVMFSRQGTKGQAWHQDCPPDEPDLFNMNRLVYTHDITEDIGGQTLVVPGSHKRGLLTTGPVDEDFPDQVELRPTKGTLVLLHGHTWHRVRPVKGTYRVSTNYRSATGKTPDDITDICVYRNMRYQFSTNRVVEERI
ncbi:MAG: phytanoyl-CoA dioxygenase family protein [bacterium]